MNSLDISKIIHRYDVESEEMCACKIWHRNGSMIERDKDKIKFNKPNGEYPISYSNIDDLIVVLDKLKQMSPSCVVTQQPGGVTGSLSILFRLKNGDAVYVGYLLIYQTKAYLWHPEYFPEGIIVEPD